MSVRALRDLGAIVDRALCVVDRQEGGRDNLAGLGVELHSLLTRMNSIRPTASIESDGSPPSVSGPSRLGTCRGTLPNLKAACRLAYSCVERHPWPGDGPGDDDTTGGGP